MNEQAMFLSLIAALVVSVPIVSIGRRSGIEPEGQRIVREAKKAGRVACGTLQSSFRSPGTGSKDRRERRDLYWLTYSYTVDGVSYTYRTEAEITGETPPETLSLYYPEGRPDKAVPAGSNKKGVGFSLWILLPFVLWFLFYRVIFS